MSSETERGALKPCPFCGGTAHFERSGTPRQSCIVSCEWCGARHESSDEGSRSGSSWNERAAQAAEAPGKIAGEIDFPPLQSGRWTAEQKRIVTLMVAQAAEAGEALSEKSEAVRWRLHRFLDAAAGEGFVIGGVDAADLFVDLFETGHVSTLSARSSEAGEALRKAAEAVEKWWVDDKIGQQLGGAPYCMFALRAALKADSQGGEKE